jgi:hypothetical protein
LIPGWLLLRRRTPRPDMTANSTLGTHGSSRSLAICLPLSLPMWALRSDVPELATVMACGRLSSDRKLGQRLRDDLNFSFHNNFSLIHSRGWRLGNHLLHKNCLGSRRSIRSIRGNIPKSDLVGWALLNGEHVSHIFVRDSL